jgi:hypothetical protein
MAEKVITALQRGIANTRWRDFGDVFTVTGHHDFSAGDLRQAMQTVAEHRQVSLASLSTALHGYAQIAQPRWAAWRRKLRLASTLPEDFTRALEALTSFAEPVITGPLPDQAVWDPARRTWEAPN